MRHPQVTKLDIGCNRMSGKPHRNSPKRAALLKAFRMRSEVSGNLMIPARKGMTATIA